MQFGLKSVVQCSMLIVKIRCLNIRAVEVKYIQLKKNHDLLKELILDNSNENDIVFDPCLGSGTTAICSVELNRHYIGFELDKGYYDIACKRLDEVEGVVNGLI